MCTPQLDRSEMFTELYRDEKKEEGDRGGQKDKRGVLPLLPAWRVTFLSIPGNHLPGSRLAFVSKGMQKERLRQFSVIDTQNRIIHWGNSFVSQAIVSERISKFLFSLR